MRDPKPPHEHFCSSCFPHRKTNGKARGWWRCFDDPCTKGLAVPCRKCQRPNVEGPTQEKRRR